ncbi:MAG: glycerophosphodiester phosphodiesterase [Candidatus Dormibacteria bacterium]
MRAYLDVPGPIGFAHRGGAGDHPENTLPAFAASVALGYRYVETDVHTTRDGVVMAFHDDVLDRTTDRAGRIADLSVAEVEAADAGHAFSADGGRSHPWRARGVRVPRLATILEEWPALRINIDPKVDASVEPLVTLLRRMNAFDRVCIGSFSDRRLQRARALSDDAVCTSMGPRAVAAVRLASWTGRPVPRSGADCMQIPVRGYGVRLVTPRLLAAAHRSGLPVHVWTVDHRSAMDRLLDWGVDGLMTDRPLVLREALRSRGAWTETG